MIEWFKDNRLKIVSVLSVTADFLMGLAGGVSFFFWGKVSHFSDISLMAGCFFGLIGHGSLIIWGKGGRQKSVLIVSKGNPVTLWQKTLTPWHYPLDWAFFVFVIAGLLYAVAGIAPVNVPLVWVGVMGAFGSALGWLWPTRKLIFGYHAIQISASIYAFSAILTFFAAWIAQNGFMAAAACVYIFSNIILYTVRKANQSAYTQAQEMDKIL